MLIPEESAANIQGLLQNSDVWVFLIGVFPFAWATVEFWRRIAFGEPFGTGSDSVIIGTDNAPTDSRGSRVLGKGALAIAYFLFASAFATFAVLIPGARARAPARATSHTSMPTIPQAHLAKAYITNLHIISNNTFYDKVYFNSYY